MTKTQKKKDRAFYQGALTVLIPLWEDLERGRYVAARKKAARLIEAARRSGLFGPRGGC